MDCQHSGHLMRASVIFNTKSLAQSLVRSNSSPAAVLPYQYRLRTETRSIFGQSVSARSVQCIFRLILQCLTESPS